MKIVARWACYVELPVFVEGRVVFVTAATWRPPDPAPRRRLSESLLRRGPIVHLAMTDVVMEGMFWEVLAWFSRLHR